MALNKMTLAALKALSYTDIDIRKSYKLERQIEILLHPPITKKTQVKDCMLRCSIFPVKSQIGCEPTESEMESRELRVKIFIPEKTESSELFLFFHGGGWVTGNVESYATTCAGLAEATGRRVISLDYSLAPEHPFPYAVEECYAAARKLFMDFDLEEEPPEDIILIGDSAGGNLSAVVSLLAREYGEFRVNRQVLIYPATYHDHTETSPFESVRTNGKDYMLTSKRLCEYMDLYIRHKEDWNSPYFAPYLCGDLSCQPETLIITAEYDPLRDEGEAYGKKLKKFGNEVQVMRITDAVHGFFSLPPVFEQVKLCHELIGRFLNSEDAKKAETHAAGMQRGETSEG